ncbi:MAG TPA: NAD(P)H-hydrate dehydratase [Candidatus Wallbacteria bacterium]|nr:NAD(P)H-hydrate dehydratase [Candidatus Wallbacteria bacterium]
MKILTAEQMRKIDSRAVNDYHISEQILMENAGIKSVLAMCEMYPEIYRKNVMVVCGPGNNGGDGFVIARHLFNLGCQVSVVATMPVNKYKGVSADNLKILAAMNIGVYELHSESSIYEVMNMANFSDIIVDAIFGTGLSKKVDGLYLALINGLNSVAAQKFAIDIPSGIDGSTGLVMGAAIKASATVTFETPKIGHILDPGSQYIGKLFVADISIPKPLFSGDEYKLNLTTEEFVAKNLIRRSPDSNKGDFGRALIIGGSRLYSGAPKIAARALLRSGAGVSFMMVPDAILNQTQSELTDVITMGLRSTSEGAIDSCSDNVESAITFIETNRISAVAIGMGMSQSQAACDFTAEILSRIKVPVCLDADGLLALKKHRAKILMNQNLKLIVTPHPKEMARILDSGVEEVLMNRLKICEDFSKAYRAVTLLKGHRTVICDESANAFINTSGNAAMAKGGMGDALCGIITGFIAGGMPAFSAAIAASYIHGKAGDLAAASVFEYSMTTDDLISKLSEAMRIITKNQPAG